MFAGIISRDHGEPWGATGLTSARWLDVPARTVRIAELMATQPGIWLAPLIGEPPAAVGGDPLPHAVAWRGGLYLEDGHHRAVRALLAGERRMTVRVLDVP